MRSKNKNASAVFGQLDGFWFHKMLNISIKFGLQATFYWKASWRIGRGPCSDTACTADDVGRLGTNVDGNSNGGNVL